ncbi:MAG: alkene reductase [Bacteroidales bacterium]
MTTLLSPFQLGSLTLKNRVVMAPLTRRRADKNFVPTPIVAEYYSQRASAGLIIAEATMVHRTSLGYPDSPGIFNREQIEGWKKVTSAVHEKGGHIYLQIWHVGRYSHPSLQENGELPVSSFPVAINGLINTREGYQPHVTPRALTLNEIPEVIDWYRQAALNAVSAGFDGVELHGANSYLIHQFLEDGVNKRQDDYGGTVEKRSRFLFEVVSAVSNAIGSGKTAIRLSPSYIKNNMTETNPVKLYSYVIEKLNDYHLSYLHLVEPLLPVDHLPHYLKEVTPFFRGIYKGTLVSCGGYTFEKARQSIDDNIADLIAFGVPFISNPDLVERFAAGAPLNPADPETYYVGGEKGYLDYPFLNS